MLFYDTEDLLFRKFSLCSFQAKIHKFSAGYQSIFKDYITKHNNFKILITHNSQVRTVTVIAQVCISEISYSSWTSEFFEGSRNLCEHVTFRSSKLLDMVVVDFLVV